MIQLNITKLSINPYMRQLLYSFEICAAYYSYIVTMDACCFFFYSFDIYYFLQIFLMKFFEVVFSTLPVY